MLSSSLFFLLCFNSFGLLTPSDLFRDHAVFQTTDDGGSAAQFVGLSTPGDLVHLQFHPALATGEDTFSCTTDNDGFYRFEVSSPSDGPFIIKISSSTESVSISDAYFGDVYLCGGQSNMQFPTKMLKNETDKNPGDAYRNIRLFTTQFWGEDAPIYIRKNAEYAADPAPQTNLLAKEGQEFRWDVCNTTTVQQFSAVCYLSGRDVMLMLGNKNRAVGLVSSNVGGTPVESWTPTTGFKSCMVDLNSPAFVQGEDATGSWDYPAMLYNQMIAPLTNNSYRAIMWYQGEANMDEGYALASSVYQCLFRNMILEWRRAMGAETPFVFMQISACGRANDYAWRWEAIREAQAKVELTTPRTGMAISFDKGYKGIHTPYKDVPSNRLAYRIIDLAFNAPTPPRPRVLGACAIVIGGRNGDTTDTSVVQVRLDGMEGLYLAGTQNCTTTGKHLCCSNPSTVKLDGAAYGIGGMSVANTNGVVGWYDATIELNDEGFLLRADTGDVSKYFLWTVRFETGSYPQCAVYNNNGLPLGPFAEIMVAPSCNFPSKGL
jgi:hypothetical protein